MHAVCVLFVGNGRETTPKHRRVSCRRIRQFYISAIAKYHQVSVLFFLFVLNFSPVECNNSKILCSRQGTKCIEHRGCKVWRKFDPSTIRSYTFVYVYAMRKCKHTHIMQLLVCVCFCRTLLLKHLSLYRAGTTVCGSRKINSHSRCKCKITTLLN